MASHNNNLWFFFVLVSFLSTFATTEAQVYLNKSCSTNITTTNSAFQFNLKTLLSSLSSNATEDTQFYNTTTVTGLDSSESVYGSFMCRGDVSSQLCHRCVANATQRLSSECSSSTQGVIWYDECMVRFSNRSFFSTVDTGPRLRMWNMDNVFINQKNFTSLLFSTMNEIANEAARPPIDVKKFAARHATITELRTLYCLAQCTPDLSPSDCRTCLSGAIGDLPLCCDGGRVLFPSCNIRFELYLFYRSGAAASPPTLPPVLVPNGQGSTSPPGPTGKARTIILIVVPTIILVMLFSFGYYLLKRKGSRRSTRRTILRENFGHESATLEPLQFDLVVIEAATNNFSDENYIGKGGFGEVYKGILFDGQQIAVKRLSRSSKQGAEEFKNEVLLVAKLQHRNLVAFIGFCLQDQEKILIYEYVTNKSLDHFLFDSQRQRTLSWVERYNIIRGIARGILYLHEHSRLKVIHRDLKPSNVLLDENMNPKISDFGLARIVEISQEQGSTNRIVGTYGYMSPEYAMFGQFSEKSDVFSFGVMILEIVAGKKNMCLYESHRVTDGLLNYVWRHWRDQTPLTTLDPNIKDYSKIEVIKCIQIGLLCVQHNPDARPTMATIVSYLSSYSIELPTPQEPTFFLQDRMDPKAIVQESSSKGSTNSSTLFSINEMSISTFVPR